MLLALCRGFRDEYNIGTHLLHHVRSLWSKPSLTLTLPSAAVVTNDIFTREDQDFLIRNDALPRERIRAIETGGCPHAAIREDISANLGALEELQAAFETEMLLVESGGDNLAGQHAALLAVGEVGVKADLRGGSSKLLEGARGLHHLRH